MAQSDPVSLSQLNDYILDGKYHDATDLFCQLVIGSMETVGH